MATGRDNQLTKQVGEYLVAAEVCRRGFIATTFTGNVPHYDIIASDGSGRHQAIQVKAIKGGAWQFDSRAFAEIRLDGKKQVIGRPTEPPYPELVCVLVRLRGHGADEFYVLTWRDLQKIAITGHRRYLKRHGGVRPRKYDSFHMAIRPETLKEHRDKWDVLEKRLRQTSNKPMNLTVALGSRRLSARRQNAFILYWITVAYRIDWLRVSIEGLVIVASILLAFGIDAQWDGRQARTEERDILQGLDTDFSANATRVASVIEIHRQNEALIARLESMSAAELAALKADSVGIYLQAMWSMPTFDARDGTLDGAVASGKLGLIRDSQLRDRLVEWKARVEDSTEEAGELRAAAGRVLGRMTELGGPWGGDTPGIGPAFTNPDLADMMRHFPSGSLTLAVNDAELMGAVREKRLRAVMYLAALLGLSDQANQVRGIIGAGGL